MNVHAPPTEDNSPRDAEVAHPQPIAPKQYAWCSYHCIGTRYPIPPEVDIWAEFLANLTDHQFFPHRSLDGETVFFVPVLTDIKWEGRC